MRYYKIIEGGYIIAIGTGGGGTEIIEAEYSQIMAVVQNKPERVGTADYRLKEDLTWEEYTRPPDPEPEPDIENIQEIAEVLLSQELVTIPTEDEPDYFNEHEPEPNYFA